MSRPNGKLFGWVLAVLVAGVFASLGVWQLGRAKQKEAMLAASQQVLAQRHALPLSAASDAVRSTAYDWSAGGGHFLDGPAVLLDNQTRDGRPGIRVYRVFVPQAGGTPLLVELGWLPLPGDRQLPVIGTIPGPAPLTGLLAPPPSTGVMRLDPVAQPNGDLLVIGLEPAALAAKLGVASLAPRVLKLDPVLPLGYARDLDILPNTLPPERHLGYAVQWFALALAVLATALILSLRRRVRR